MMTPDNVARLREVLGQIVAETTLTADLADGVSIAERLAQQSAAIAALAQAVSDLLPQPEPERRVHPSVRQPSPNHVYLRDLG